MPKIIGHKKIKTKCAKKISLFKKLSKLLQRNLPPAIQKTAKQRYQYD